MNHRERVKAVMHYERYDRLPCVDGDAGQVGG